MRLGRPARASDLEPSRPDPCHVLFLQSGKRWAAAVRSRVEKEGWRVRSVSSLPELLQYLEQRIPELLALDTGISDVPIESLLVLLKRKAPSLRICLLSSPGCPALSEAESLGVCCQLWKPLDAEILGSTLLAALQRVPRPSVGRRPDAPHVLCVDDDPLFLRSLERMLSRHGYRVTGFGDPCCAGEAVPVLRPDVAILDIRMPEMDGWELSRAIRRRSKDLPIILLSGDHGDPPYWHAADEVGLMRLPKPSDPETVLGLVDQLVEAVAPCGPAALEVDS